MNICVFGASGDELDPLYFEAAEELGRLLATAGHRLVFGGGAGGLMGACARGAASQGGEIIGIAPRFFDEPGILFSDCTEFIYTETMAQRKMLMEEKAEAFIALPGGIGTFEEFFETLTLKQLGRHDRAMVLLNTLDYYAPLVVLLRHAAEGGFLSERCFELFSVCDRPREALFRVETDVPMTGSIRRLSDYNK